MKYKDINALDARIERIIKKHVKHYYTDWKNYDRPKYMGLKGSTDKADREMILIARTCGTYLITEKDATERRSAAAIIEYYFNQERNSSTFYYIDLNRLQVTRCSDEDMAETLKDLNKRWNEKTA